MFLDMIYLLPANVLSVDTWTKSNFLSYFHTGRVSRLPTGFISENATKLIFWIQDSPGSFFLSLFVLAAVLFICFTIAVTSKSRNVIMVKQLEGTICLSWIPPVSVAALINIPTNTTWKDTLNHPETPRRSWFYLFTILQFWKTGVWPWVLLS